MMGALSAWWQDVADEHGAAEALARLCVQLGQETDRQAATFLAETALSLVPTSTAALALIERRTPDPERRALWLRYETFLANAPSPEVAADVRDRLIALLFELGHTYSALVQVDAQLTAVTPCDLTDSAIEAAYQALLAEQQATEQAESDAAQVAQLSRRYVPAFDELADAAE